MTVEQAAEYCGVTTMTIRRWCDAGLLNYWRTPGGARRVWKDDAAEQARDDHARRRR